MAKLKEALQACYRGRVTQAEVAEAVGTDQATVSRWVNGKQSMSLEQIAAFEAACDRTRGWVLIHAGFVDVPTDVRAAIAVDPALDDDARRAMLKFYDAYVS